MTRAEIIAKIESAGYSYGGYMRRMNKTRLLEYLEQQIELEEMYRRIANA